MKGPSGASIKRKSIERADPVLPKPKNQRQRTTEGRTNHKDYKPPAEQLKQFRKKQLYTLSTQKSLTNLNSSDHYTLRQSGFDDDHHNTQSIAQLLSNKMNSNLPTVRAKLSGNIRPSIPDSDDRLTSQKQSLESDSLAAGESEARPEGAEASENEQVGRQGQNYDDYVLGQKVSEDEEGQSRPFFKKYQNQQSSKSLQPYVAKSQTELRLEQRYWNSERKKLLSFKQDRQIIAMMEVYQNQKKVVMNQSKRKHEVARVMASLPKIGQHATVQKSASLPLLKPKMEVIVPELIEDDSMDHLKRNIIAKGFGREENSLVTHRLKQSLSFGKLAFGAKRVRTICQQEVYEDEMDNVEQIRNKLRSKGIFIDPNRLVKGLTNNKNPTNPEKPEGYPSGSLPSNPMYKKFPL